ncbi:MAG: transcription-repair coupling factor [bacterium]|nr:transcription-repair coupling factor [bacterium]MDD3804944.1 transcription-repair coupling factor [bacterium]MDD4152833.1 transcription-repair coupling factor [bacterium]MDD4558310.1 transcription-repair coupling factor [bacterium]
MSLGPLVQLWKRSASFNLLMEKLSAGNNNLNIEGLSGSEISYLMAAVRRYSGRPLLLITVDDRNAERISEELHAFLDDNGVSREVSFFPASAGDAPEVTRLRLSLLQRMEAGQAAVVVSGLRSALEPLRLPSDWKDACFEICSGQNISTETVSSRLLEMGYERETLTSQPGQFSLRGGVLDIFPPASDLPFRLELWGEAVDSIRLFDPRSQLSRAIVEQVIVSPAAETASPAKTEISTLIEYLPSDTIVVLEEPHRLEAHYRRIKQNHQHILPLEEAQYRWKAQQVLSLSLLAMEDYGEPLHFETAGQESFGGRLSDAVEAVKSWRADDYLVLLVSDQASRLAELLAEYDLVVGGRVQSLSGAVIALRENIYHGFRLPEIGLAVLTDKEIFGWRKSRTRKSSFYFSDGERLSLLEAQAGDYVVHVQHGIGLYKGLVKLESDGISREYLHIQYAGNDKLYVPSDQIDRLQKFVAAGDEEPKLHRLDSNEWNRIKRRVKEAARDMAHELLNLYARREQSRGFAFSADTPWQRELESSFPYTETPDQLRAIQETKRDMESELPMDRLICGDVGYGKTEVAVRAAFKAVQDGKQVAVLVPTTVLALQHYNTFCQRLGAYPVKIEMLSRFRSAKEQRDTLECLALGELDIVIGTHRLVQKDVAFKNLGLLIIDEEQRFGVTHKERLKEMRLAVDVLTLTATPIPRTLHMALSGLRYMSVIDTPPEGKMPVKTLVTQYDDNLIRQAVERELDRGGQIYFVSNRIEGIESYALRLQQLIPYARIAIAHGQMSEARLEKIMLEFYRGEYDILVCTTIIENGVDIPNVNTIIMNDADHLGLAQMYQLRGRVGRGQHQAYAYLLYRNEHTVSQLAEKRLSAIRDFSELGSGLKVAMRDLQIRGAGNILGAEQHGFIQAVGLELYCQLLAESVEELKGQVQEDKPQATIDIPLDAFIPRSYINDERLRMEFYRRLAGAEDEMAVERIAAELADRFGRRPREANNLIFVVRIRLLAAQRDIRNIYTESGQITINGSLPSRNMLRGRGGVIARYRKHLMLMPDRLVINTDGLTQREWTTLLEAALDTFARKELCA